MIRCIDVHKSYQMGDRQVPALRGVDLTIERPGFYAIMGQSGSGKSTLLHLLAALDRPDRGQITIAGRAIHDMDEKAATLFRRKGIGIVFQQFNLIPTLTARENVELPGMLAGDDAAALTRRSAELLERLGMNDRATHRPDALSGGEQQRIAIARALMNDPPLVIADEPTGNLDPDLSLEIMNLLREVNAGGTTVLVATHDRELIRLVGRRSVTLDHGRIVEVS
jgi:putative ABC transport system ATP-binding protein